MLDNPGAFSEATGAMFASEKAPGWPHMAYNHVLCPCKMFQGHFGSCRDIFGQEGIFWVMKFLHCRAILGHEWPFMVMNGHFWSRRAIFGHKGPFLVLFWAIMGPPWASEKGPGWSNMTYNHVIYPLEVFRVMQ